MELQRKVRAKRIQTEEEPFVSVLTPVYNGAEYLRECIESVLKQSYNNWEYVLVNNQSTDGSLQIMQEYADTDERIRIHNNKDFLPQLENLNHAFRQISADSKYCKVVHADDMIFENCLRKMVSLAEEYPSVGIVSSYRLDDRRVGLTGLPYTSEYIDGREICRDFMLGNSYYFGAPSTLLLRSSLIRKREHVYDESYLTSDISACLDILRESDFGFVHQVLSYTRRHKGSVTNQVAKKNSTFIFGYLKVHFDYAHYFLEEDELKDRNKRRIDIFYIQFARQILEQRSLEKYRLRKKDLAKLHLPFNRMKLIKHILTEMLKVPIINFLEKKGFTQGKHK